jgi:superfamily I DNA and/or RNA helicase
LYSAIEAGIVLEIVTTLVDNGVISSRIGVMAPFRKLFTLDMNIFNY